MIPRWRASQLALLAGFFALLPLTASAQKPQAAVTGIWIGAPTRAQQHADLDLVLRLTATEDAALVTVDFIAPDGVEIVGGSTQWTGAVENGTAIDIPVKARVV